MINDINSIVELKLHVKPMSTIKTKIMIYIHISKYQCHYNTTK